MDKIAQYLWEASGKKRNKISQSNPFRDIGFDGENPRLGWVIPPSWSAVERALKRCLAFIGNKDEFIFIGMGGSVNGIKAVSGFIKKPNIHYLDSLDPLAMGEVLSKIKNINNTMVISISKSGTTKETHLLAHTLRYLFKKDATRHFLWLVDRNCWKKLDPLGWKGFRRLSIQIDGNIDIGGRFTSPHTLIFLLPLFLMLDRDFQSIQMLYLRYCSLKDKIIAKSLRVAGKYKSKEHAYFCVILQASFLKPLRTWVTQLFQESLGSKKDSVNVKTLVAGKERKHSLFSPVTLNMKIKDPIVNMVATMYYLQTFVALFALFKGINFVNQPSVEKYKQQMKKINPKKLKRLTILNTRGLVKAVKRKLKPDHKFIEIILYFHAQNAVLDALAKEFHASFPRHQTFIFTGSDWNHHSYQAAVLGRDTFFVLLTRDNYSCPQPVNAQRIKENIQVLRNIAYATYITIKNKSLLSAFRV